MYEDIPHFLRRPDVYLESKNLPGIHIAGMVMFNALKNALIEAESTDQLTTDKRQVVARQIAFELEKLADAYGLDYTIDLEKHRE